MDHGEDHEGISGKYLSRGNSKCKRHKEGTAKPFFAAGAARDETRGKARRQTVKHPASHQQGYDFTPSVMGSHGQDSRGGRSLWVLCREYPTGSNGGSEETSFAMIQVAHGFD